MVAIYLEVRQSRQARFFEAVTAAGANKDRGEIYEEYVRLTGEFPDLKTRTLAFLKVIHAKPAIRDACDSQVRLLNDMGFTATRGLGRRHFIELFPHGPIFLWLIAGPYVEERREDTGPWYARHMLVFAERSVKYVKGYMEKSGKPLVLRSKDSTIWIEIKLADLKQMHTELKALIE